MISMTLSSTPWRLNLSLSPKLKSLEDWWNQILFIDNGYVCTRKELVLSIANTDGVHVDPNLGQNYSNLTRLGSISTKFFIDNKRYIPQGPETLLIPQIGLETVSSLKHAYPQLCRDMKLPYIQF